FGWHDGHQRHEERQDRLRRVGRHVDGKVVHDIEGERGIGEVARALAGDLVAEHAVEGVLDVTGIEGGAVREGDVRPQLELPGAVVLVSPALREAGDQHGTATYVEFGQRFAVIAHDHATDVGAGCHARLDQVELLAEHDGDVGIGLRHGWYDRGR